MILAAILLSLAVTGSGRLSDAYPVSARSTEGALRGGSSLPLFSARSAAKSLRQCSMLMVGNPASVLMYSWTSHVRVARRRSALNPTRLISYVSLVSAST